MLWQRRMHVAVDAGKVFTRRDFVRGVSATSVALGLGGWNQLSLRAEDLRRRGKACILLWMQGAPSQFETFSPKPQHENGGDTQAISTSVPGIEVAANFPELAKVMDHVALLRSLTSKEGNHQRASYYLHTGYIPNASVKYPSLGAIISHQLSNAACELPSFVRIGEARNSSGGGFLGVEYDPFVLATAEQLPANTSPTTDVARYQRRLSLLDRLEAEYSSAGGARQVEDHRKLYGKASRMIQSAQMKAFDLEDESPETRDAYGRTKFGAGCLLARRLVEAGVPFVEVAHGNWDTHQDNFDRTAQLASDVDQPFAQLIRDLDSRGLLDSTLIVWMGEFGRTPKINGRGGRDHYPRAFNAALAGCGIQGGRVIGKTDDGGVEVTERPILVNDLFQTFCQALSIDPNHENMSGIGRPIKIVDGGQPVSELFA